MCTKTRQRAFISTLPLRLKKVLILTVYADENYYKSEYLCGRKAVITSAFAYYAREATLIINAYTGSNIDDTKDIIEPVKLCCCEVAELMYKADNMSGSEGITSEKVGDVSRSYESCEVRKKQLTRCVKSAVYKYLADTDLLYRGV
jgi:hypothetical protein